jgi:transcriptional regulator with XRE-family HTH domain
MTREWLREMRTNKGFSQTKVARDLGVARQNYAAYENGTKTPRSDRMFSLSEILGPEVIEHFKAEARETKGVA